MENQETNQVKLGYDRPYKLGEAVMQDEKFAEEVRKRVISDYMSSLGKLSHQKSPRPREFYSKMGSKSHRRGGKHKK